MAASVGLRASFATAPLPTAAPAAAPYVKQGTPPQPSPWRQVATGLSLTSLSAGLAAVSLTPALLRVASSLPQALPTAVHAVAGVAGLGGLLVGGCLTASLLAAWWPLLNVRLHNLDPAAAAASQTRAWYGLLPHWCLLGLSCSPLLLHATLPTCVLGVALASCVGAGLLLTYGTHLPSVLLAGSACIAAVCLGTLSLAVGTGAATAGIVTHSLILGAALLLGLAAARGAWELLFAIGVQTYGERFQLAPAALQASRLDIAGRREPTVFEVPQQLLHWAAPTPQMQPSCLVLYGAPGCGKTALVKGLAQALDALLVVPNYAELSLDKWGHVPATWINLLAVLLESYAKVRQTRQAMVVLLDEIESLWAPPPSNPLELFFHNNLQLGINLLVRMAKKDKLLLLFVGTTNHPENIYPFLPIHFVHQTPASRPNLSKMAAHKLHELDRSLQQLHVYGPPCQTPTHVQRLADAMHLARLDGRSLDACVEQVRFALLQQVAQATDVTYSATDVQACLSSAIRYILAQPNPAAATPSTPPASPRPAASWTHTLAYWRNNRNLILLGSDMLQAQATVACSTPAQSLRQQALLERYNNSQNQLATLTLQLFST